MLQIYHAPGTRSIRPIWLCFELGLEVEIISVPFTSEYLTSDKWREISPAGKLPILRDGDLTMFESGAMMDYILETYGNGLLRPPPGTPASALHQQWSWFAESTLARPLGLSRMLKGDGNEVAAIAKAKVNECLSVVEDALTGKDYLLDNFYSADIMMGYTLELLQRFKLLNPEQHPNTVAYLNSLKTREACRKAMAA